MPVPKGDVLHQFRQDVRRGSLPAVSWIVAPENFSDHPGAAWYGAWYIAEVLDILTHNPEVWKKTIFILTYDENDGYFDHVPPFVPPHPARPETGSVARHRPRSRILEPGARPRARPKTDARGRPIGLGYRVPLVIASPWSRGGCVCSQVFDHTSVLQLLESIVKVRETNISAWRRTVCGDLSSAFQPAGRGPADNLAFTKRDAELEKIHKAQFRPLPGGFLREIAKDAQEKGVRPSLPLPYELHAGGALAADRRSVEISMEAANRRFGRKSAGSAFHVYTPGLFRQRADLRTRAYAVEPGKRLTDTWPLDGFPDGVYRLAICGPNGFLRELTGSADDPAIDIRCEDKPSGDLVVFVSNRDPKRPHTLQIAAATHTLKPGQQKSIPFRLAGTRSWYDIAVRSTASRSLAAVSPVVSKPAKWASAIPRWAPDKIVYMRVL